MTDAASPALALIPQPVKVEATGSDFPLPEALGIWNDFETGTAGAWLSDALARLTGQTFESTAGRGVDVQIAVNPRWLPEPVRKPEGYTLSVTSEGVRVTGFDVTGALYGCVTLTQLLRKTDTGWVFTGAEVSDAPRFEHRGAMLDIARHFFGPDVIRGYIDRMVSLKLNRLHLHLADDQGWRIQIDSWPDLAAKASTTSALGDQGGFLTKTDYTDIVNYAAARGITVIPEFDLPGHTHAISVAYPQFMEPPFIDDRLREQSKMRGQDLPEFEKPFLGFGVGHSSVKIGDEATYAFLNDVLRELAELTPGPYIHIGGDECFANSEEDFDAFMGRITSDVVALGKTPIAWHEAGETHHLAPGTLGQYWNWLTPDRRSDHLAKVRTFLSGGGKVILSPCDAVYLDMKETPESTVGVTWTGTTSLERTYNWDPGTLLDGISEDDVLGVESPLWTETVRTPADIDYQLFPRLIAVAEVGWSTEAAKGWESFQQRLTPIAAGLRALGFGVREDNLVTTGHTGPVYT